MTAPDPFWQRLKATAQSPEAQAYHNHIFGCPACYPPAQRYCRQGFELWAAKEVPVRADQIVEERDLRRRRALVEAAPEPLRDQVKAEVKRLWHERRDAAIWNR